jgi:hypothetical protein
LVLLLAIFCRVVTLNLPGVISVISSSGAADDPIIGSTLNLPGDHVSAMQGIELAFAELVELSESFEEQLEKKAKHPLLLITFILSFSVITNARSFCRGMLLLAVRSVQRLYLSFSILRI